MNIIPWRRGTTPLPNMDLDDLFTRVWSPENGDSFRHLPRALRGTTPFPPVNVAESESEFAITMDLPGMQEDDFDVQCTGDRLVVSGERKWESETENKEFRCVESQYGKFERTVRLPENAAVDPEEIKAGYKKGILTINVPKRERTPTARIPVHAG